MTRWRKSSFSANADQCVEVAGSLDAVRDSKAAGQVLAVPEFRQLIRHIKRTR
jgi:Domain of unknown function (DUF397)